MKMLILIAVCSELMALWSTSTAEVFTITSPPSLQSVNITYNYNASAPDPSTLLLLGAGLCSLSFWGRRRKISRQC